MCTARKRVDGRRVNQRNVVYSYKILTDETNVCVVVDVLNRVFCQTTTNYMTTTMALGPDIRIHTNFMVDHSSDLGIYLFVRKAKP